MGASVSTNYSDNVNKIVNEAVNNSMIDATGGSDQGIVFDIDAPDAKYISVKGNNFGQTVNFNADTFSDSLLKQQNNSDIDSTLISAAAASVSGINFGNVAIASNIIQDTNSIANKTISDISSSVRIFSGQTIDFKINAQGAEEVIVEDNDFNQVVDQIIDIKQTSLTEAYNSSTVVSQVEANAEADVVGINVFGCLIILAIIILISIGGFLTSPLIMLLLSSLFIVFAFVIFFCCVYQEIVYYGFSGGEQFSACTLKNSVSRVTDNIYKPQDAGDGCLNDPECGGFSWDHATHRATYYSGDISCKSVSQDTSNLTADQIRSGNVPDYIEYDWVGIKRTSRNIWWVILSGIFFFIGSILCISGISRLNNKDDKNN